jgi:hypothetical protein
MNLAAKLLIICESRSDLEKKVLSLWPNWQTERQTTKN